MKKIITILLCTVLLIGAIPMNTFAFDIISDKDLRVYHTDGTSTKYGSFSAAFSKLSDGDAVSLVGDELDFTADSGVEISKKVTFTTGADFNGNRRQLSYSDTGTPLFKITNGGMLTLKNSEIYLKDSDTFGYGKLIIVEQGGTLVLDGTADEPLKFLGSCDGLILVKDGGKIILNGAIFEGNPSGDDIKVEDGGAVIGDLNGDRIIDIRDLVHAKKHLASPKTVTTVQSLDYNRDGNVNANDLILLKLYLLKSE